MEIINRISGFKLNNFTPLNNINCNFGYPLLFKQPVIDSGYDGLLIIM